jgi:hypothetical protein
MSDSDPASRGSKSARSNSVSGRRPQTCWARSAASMAMSSSPAMKRLRAKFTSASARRSPNTSGASPASRSKIWAASRSLATASSQRSRRAATLARLTSAPATAGTNSPGLIPASSRQSSVASAAAAMASSSRSELRRRSDWLISARTRSARTDGLSQASLRVIEMASRPASAASPVRSSRNRIMLILVSTMLSPGSNSSRSALTSWRKTASLSRLAVRALSRSPANSATQPRLQHARA